MSDSPFFTNNPDQYNTVITLKKSTALITLFAFMIAASVD